MDLLTAIRILNAALTLGDNYLEFQRNVGAVIEQAIAEGSDTIPADRWENVAGNMERSDARLAAVIAEKKGSQA